MIADCATILSVRGDETVGENAKYGKDSDPSHVHLVCNMPKTGCGAVSARDSSLLVHVLYMVSWRGNEQLLGMAASCPTVHRMACLLCAFARRAALPCAT